jgi:hypothetical protein
MNMLTTESIFRTLNEKHFENYKKLLRNVTVACEQYAGRLPSEIGPRDLVARAAASRWLKQDADGSIRIVVSSPRSRRRSLGLKTKGDKAPVARTTV